MSIELINDFRKVKRMTIALGKAGAKFSTQLHTIAFNCILLIDNVGDIRPLQELHDVLTPANQRALAAWAKEFAKVSYDTEAHLFKFAKGKTTRRIDAEEISPLAFEKARTKPKAAVFNLLEALDRLIDKGRKNNASGPAWDAVLLARTKAA